MPNHSLQSQDTKTLRTPDGTPVRCLYVTNISKFATYQDLQNIFSRFGTIKLIFLQKFSQSRNSTYAFVTFETPEQAYRAHSLRTSLKLRGKKIFTWIADSWHQPIVGPNGGIIYNPRSIDKFDIKTESSEDSEEEEENDCEEEAVNSEICPIAKLNDDCLLHVFDYIPFSNHHVLSHVCRRWRNLMMNYWSKITKLDFKEKPFVNVPYTEKNLRLYLKLCPNITSVKLSAHFSIVSRYASNVEDVPSAYSIVIAASLCRQLEELSIEGIEMKNRPLTAVAHCCRNLKVLRISNCNFPRDSELSSVMRKCIKLEILHISHSYMNPSAWLKHLQPGLKSFSLVGCEVNPFFLVRGLPRLKNSLQHLEIVVESGLDPLDFKSFHGFSKLETIIYTYCSLKNQKTSPDMFRNLNRLELEGNKFVSDDIMKGIVEHSPNLTILNLSRSKNPHLTTEGLKEIFQLTDLVNLNLSFNEINDDYLIELVTHVKNLEKLSLNSCNKISDTGCRCIVSKLFKLKEIYLTSCKVTNKTVAAAVDASVQNPDKETLRMFVAHTNIPEVQMLSHDKVELSFSNVSDSWLHEGFFRDFSNFLFDEDDFDDDDDDDDYELDVYSDCDPEDYFLDMDEFGNMNYLHPLNFYLNLL